MLVSASYVRIDVALSSTLANRGRRCVESRPECRFQTWVVVISTLIAIVICQIDRVPRVRTTAPREHEDENEV